MADQLNMGGLNLGSGGPDQQTPTNRSYIPPHLRKMGGAPGPAGPGGSNDAPTGSPPAEIGAPALGPAPAGVNGGGLNSRASGYVNLLLHVP
jgi:ATP-dependent RNA helicase DDX3X